jgi:hypothetical protein
MSARDRVENEAMIEVMFDRISERIAWLIGENEKLEAAVARLQRLLDEGEGL